MAIIDVGANVGDTAALLAEGSDVSILCIEGGREFFELLGRNTTPYGERVEVSESFLGREESSVDGELKFHNGTAHFEQKASGISTRVLTLPQTLAQHPRFLSSRILKSDTDGYDCEVLRGALPWLREAKAVIFVEFIPKLLEKVSADYLETFQLLHEVGYDLVISYRNTGEYFNSGHLNDPGFIADLELLTRKSYGAEYFDLFLFHKADDELGRRFRQIERELHR